MEKKHMTYSTLATLQVKESNKNNGRVWPLIFFLFE